MAIHESGQMYLETIYILSQNSTFVRAIDVGEQLGFTKPSVSRAMSILKKDGYVNVDADGAKMCIRDRALARKSGRSPPPAYRGSSGLCRSPGSINILSA